MTPEELADLETAAEDIVKTVQAAIWRHPAYAFIAGGQLRLMRAGVGPRRAWRMSKDCLIEFMKSEKITFGDPRYKWTDEDGASLVEEMEIRHWEAS